MTATADPARVLPPFDGLGQLLPRLAAKHGGRTAPATDERTLSFDELDRESSRVASSLRDRGIQPGERVAVLSQNRWEWIVAYHGVLKLGAVVTPLNVMLTAEEAAFILTDAGACALIASGERLDAVGAVLADLPGLRLVISFDETQVPAVPFADLLLAADEGDAQPYAVDPDGLPASPTPPAPPGTRRARCSRTAPWCSTAPTPRPCTGVRATTSS